MTDCNVLVVERDEERVHLVRTLKEAGVATCEAGSVEGARALLHDNAGWAEAVVLRMELPGADDLGLLDDARASPESAFLPVLLVSTRLISEGDVALRVDAGAIDVFRYPICEPVLVAKARAACARYRREQSLVQRLRDAEREAATDRVTGLFSRGQLAPRLTEACAQMRRRREPLSVVMLDIDHFKAVNDGGGHPYGDRALQHFASVLRRVVRAEDLAFRYGGDEFTVLLQRCDGADTFGFFRRLRASLRESPLSVNARSFLQMTVSGGFAIAEVGATVRGEELVERADAALYEAKRRGRDRIHAWGDGGELSALSSGRIP